MSRKFSAVIISILLIMTSMSSYSGETVQPKIIELSGMTVVGIQVIGNPVNGDFAKTWPTLFERCDEINSKYGKKVSYGIQTYDTELMKGGKWLYLAGLEVEVSKDVPKSMEAISLPSNKYAVFEYHGAIGPELGELFQYIYKEWLPNSEFVVAGHYDFEKYDERFRGPENQSSIFEIYVPIEAK